MLISKYVRIIKNEPNSILYNTIKHSIIEVPNNIIQGKEIRDDCIDEKSKKVLDEMGFFNNNDNTIEQNLEKYIINKDKLFISIELNLSCNLRCPYCYQSGKNKKGLISDKSLDDLIEYFKKVYERQKYKEIYIKILGGEPTLVWNKFMYIYDKAKEFCKERNIKFNILIDTNGTKIDDILKLKDYDSLLLTIPLTHKKMHDKVRFDASGNGTYDLIIKNINELKAAKPEAKIVIRYNVDNENIKYFKDFLVDIKEKLIFEPLISVNYTSELNGSEEFKNMLSYTEFVDWSCSTAIDNLVEENLPVTISPIISIEECQYRSKYSLKLFSDGTVGSCAMSFFDKDRERINDVIKELDDNLLSSKKKKQTIMSDEECLRCDSLFICGGTNKLPCIKALNSKMCEQKEFGINLEKFIQRYKKYKEEGKGNLFVVFENGESYR